MNCFVLWFAIFFCQELPFKPKEEFEVKLDYQFKQRPAADPNSVKLDETRQEHERRMSSAILPYLILNVKMLKLSADEVRVRVSNNLNGATINKKVSEGSVLPIDMGFTDDVKDRVTPHEYVIVFLSPQKKNVSKVVINVDEDGIFTVNGERRGKF